VKKVSRLLGYSVARLKKGSLVRWFKKRLRLRKIDGFFGFTLPFSTVKAVGCTGKALGYFYLG